MRNVEQVLDICKCRLQGKLYSTTLLMCAYANYDICSTLHILCNLLVCQIDNYFFVITVKSLI